MICVSISHISQINPAIKSGAGMIELRLDLMDADTVTIFRSIPDQVKTIATCRPESYDQAEREVILKSCMEQGATYIDLEVESPDAYLAALTGQAKRSGAGVIISFHDFKQTPEPDQLEAMLLRCYNSGGDIAKIATHVNSIKDVVNLLGLYGLPGKKVVLGMGEKGRITRVMGPYLGAEFTFATPGEGDETAPGQLTMKQLVDIYKVIGAS